MWSIFGIIEGLLKSIPFIYKWFQKDRGDKVKDEQEAVEDSRKFIDKFKETGRPPK